MKLLLLFLIGFSFLTQATEFPAAARRDQGLLGDGFDTNTAAFKRSCVAGTWKYAGYTEASGEFVQKVSESDLEKQLGISGSYGEKMGAAKMSASASFAKNSKSRGFSISAIYRTRYTGYNFKLAERKISDEVKHCLTDKNLFIDGDGKTCFIPSCGNEFLEQITTTAAFYFSVRVEFSNKEELDEFNANFSFKSKVKDISAELKNKIEKSSRNARISVAVLQVGGHIDKMSRAFNSVKVDGKGGAEDYKSCSMGNIESCLNVITGAVEYATGSGENDFPAQLKAISNFKEGDVITQIPSGVSVHYYITKPYTDLGVQSPFNAIVGKEVERARKNITELYTEVANLVEDVDFYLEDFITLTSAQKLFFERVREDLDTYRDEIVEASKKCMPGMFNITSGKDYSLIIKEIEECPTVYDNLKSSFDLSLYNRGILFEIKPYKFQQFCELSLRKKFKREEEEKMLALRANMQGYLTAAKKISQKAAHSSASTLPDSIENVEDAKASCAQIADIFLSVREVDFSGLGLTNLEPLKEFSHFEEINLTDNRVTDIGHLSGNYNLSVLKLGQNELVTLRGIHKLKKLRVLVLNSNNLRSVDVLNSMTNLVKVDIRDNFEELSCKKDLPNIYSCLDYNLRGDIQISSAPTSFREVFYHPSSVTLKDGRILIVGSSGVFEVYDPNLQRSVAIGNIKAPGRGHTLTLLDDGRALLIGGEKDQSGVTVFDGVSFSRLQGTKFPHAFHTATKLNDGRVLIVGGAIGNASYNTHKSLSAQFEIFNPNTNEIEDKISHEARTTVHARAWHTATLLPDGNVLLIGGYDKNMSASISLEVFNYRDETFRSLKTKLAGPRSSHTSTLLDDGRILIVGGFQAVQQSDGLFSLIGQPLVEVYNLKISKVEQLEDQYLARVLVPQKDSNDRMMQHLGVGGHTAVKLSNGMILFGGGTHFNRQVEIYKENDTYDTADASIFDPVSNTFLPLSDRFDLPRAFMSYAKYEDSYGKEKIMFFGSENARVSMTPEVFYFNRLERDSSYSSLR